MDKEAKPLKKTATEVAREEESRKDLLDEISELKQQVIELQAEIMMTNYFVATLWQNY